MASRAKVIVAVALVGAAAFGLFVGYLAFSNDSFPARTMPFGDYATVTSSQFNGTEFAISVAWTNSTVLPLYAQLTSPSTDAANTPVCDIGLTAVNPGQPIFMPFSITPASATLSDVDLRIAVGTPSAGAEFTISYSFASVSGVNSMIRPSNVTCSQGPSIE